MELETQIAIAAIGSVSCTLIALVIVGLLLRLIGEQEDDTILREIRLLRKEMMNTRVVNNYIVFNHTRNAIVAHGKGVVNDSGEVTKFRKFAIDSKYLGREVRVIVVLQDGEESGIFGEIST